MRHLLGLSIVLVAVAAAAYGGPGGSGPAGAAEPGSARYSGVLYIDGKAPPSNVFVWVLSSDGKSVCGFGIAYIQAPFGTPDEAWYTLDIASGLSQPGCPADGGPITFRATGPAGQTLVSPQSAVFKSGDQKVYNLYFYTKPYHGCPRYCPITMPTTFLAPTFR